MTSAQFVIGLTAAAALAQASAVVAQDANTATEERAVYSAVLPSLLRGEASPRGPFLLDTTVRLRSSPFSGGRPFQFKAIPEEYQAALFALEALDDSSMARISDLTLSSVHLVSAAPVDSSVGEPFPPQCSVLRVSRVGFNESRDRAAVYVEVRCHDSGHGEIVLVANVGGSWAPVHWLNVWAAG